MKYSKEKLLEIVPTCETYTEVVRKITGRECVSCSSINLVSKKIKEYGINTAHFDPNKNNSLNLKKYYASKRNLLVNDPTRTNRVGRARLLSAIELDGSKPYKCEVCGNEGVHNGATLILQIDHIDGDWRNNEIGNLRFLCPNCHSQTETFGFSVAKYT